MLLILAVTLQTDGIGFLPAIICSDHVPVCDSGFECFCHILEKFPDRKVLGTYFLAFSALNAFGCFTVSSACNNAVIVEVCVPVMEGLVGIKR